ncbi:type IV toxin-antitoxin system AbiEi family antitoxin domain-containing protein [Promicromonospora sp. NPDC023805]|uniref:type IV toxin-antitoxin system AbiEi family antitoxin domain-containing protein n=1 Tax=Promicromonospora sp. NPDC023805 TaxID=3154696 RepID=UPI0033CAD110
MRPKRTLPHPLLSLAAAQEGLVNKAQCDAAGVNKHAVALLIRQGRWARVTRCVYDTDPEPVELRLRDGRHDDVRRRAAWIGMLAVPDGIATGACALALLGVGGLPADLVPEAARPGGMYASVGAGIVLRRYRSFADVPYRGRQIAALVPALAQALPYLPRYEAVAVLSDALHKGLLDEAGLESVRELVRGRRGAAQVHCLFDLVEERDGSTAETYARLSFIDNGVPPDGQQVTFVTGGLVLARVDFVWTLPDGRYVVVEIDGRAFHSGEAMLADDAARQNGLLATGRVIVLRFPAARALGDGGRSVGDEMAERLARLGWRPGSPVSPRIDLDLPAPSPAAALNVGVVAG